MLFIGQIHLDPAIFGATVGKMAYVFMSENVPLFGPQNAEPDSGENAVVIQPGDNRHLLTKPFVDGPSIYRWEKGERKLLFRRRVRVPCEYAVSLIQRQDPDEHELDLDLDDDEDPLDKILCEIDDCKLGGYPVFIQDPEWPYPDSRRLLLQLVWDRYPFHLALGDGGSLYAFLSRDGASGKLLWQCY
jgi:hypothetical protein